MATQTYVYNGMPEAQQKAWMLEMTKNLTSFPAKQRPGDIDYAILKRDDEATRLKKVALRNSYNAMRVKELEAKLITMDAVLSIAGVTFPKGEPVSIEVRNLDDGTVAAVDLGIDLASIETQVEIGRLRRVVGSSASIGKEPAASPPEVDGEEPAEGGKRRRKQQ